MVARKNKFIFNGKNSNQENTLWIINVIWRLKFALGRYESQFKKKQLTISLHKVEHPMKNSS